MVSFDPARVSLTSKVHGTFPASGICEGVMLGLVGDSDLNTGQLLSIVRGLPGVRCATPLIPNGELGNARRLFRVTLDCAKLAVLAQDDRIEFIEHVHAPSNEWCR